MRRIKKTDLKKEYDGESFILTANTRPKGVFLSVKDKMTHGELLALVEDLCFLNVTVEGTPDLDRAYSVLVDDELIEMAKKFDDEVSTIRP